MKSKLGQGKSLFQVWMHEESDLVQALGRSYGERVAMDEAVRVFNTADPEIRYGACLNHYRNNQV